MKRRCDSPKFKQYKNYGERGISVCDEWRTSFTNFRIWAISNGYNESAAYGECTLDRINTNGNYEPSNCRWVNLKIQENNRLNNQKIIIGQESKTMAEWQDATGIHQGALRYRLHSNGTEKILRPVKTPRTITLNNETHTIQEWSEIIGLNHDTIYRRLQKGWGEKDALLTPPRKGGKHD